MDGSIPITSPITATGNTGPLLADSDVAPLTITITASTVTGTTPSATFTAERCTPGTDTGSITWDDADAVAASALTAAGTKTITLPAKVAASGLVAGWWRLKWTVTGTTPSFTISVATAAG
ncbi:MAG TPA: hypothetical protein VHX15_15725 [Frankiaceae bacterium]|jgi:hypothetical protein|nr:hypothetical protein [Frankiaceae bacterium]